MDWDDKSGESAAAAILNALPFPAFVVDQHHRIQCANRWANEVAGVPSLHGAYCPKAMHGLDAPFPGCPLEECVLSGEVVERELHDERSGRWVRSSVFPTSLSAADGSRLFLHFAADITADKERELGLLRSAEIQSIIHRLFDAPTHRPLPELLTDALDALLTVPWLSIEHRGCIFLRESSGALVMSAMRGLDQRICNACSKVPVGHCLCGRAALSGELVHASGVDARHEVHYEGMLEHGHYCVPVTASGAVIGVLNLYLRAGHAYSETEARLLRAVGASLGSVIEHHRAEQARARLAAVLESTSVFVGTATTEGQVLTLNESLRALAGVGQHDELSSLCIAQFHPAWAQHVILNIGIPEALRSGTWTGETALLARDGSEIPVSQVILAQRLPDGRVDFVATIMRDITEQKRLEREFLQAQKMEAIGLLASGVAHDFNNILTIIASHAQFLLADVPQGTQQHADVGEIRQACLRAAALTRQLLAFGGRRPADPRELVADEAVEGLAKMLRRLLGENIRLRTDAASRGTCIRIDPGHLEQILINLAINARDAMPMGGELTLSTRLETGLGSDSGLAVVLGVSDTGGGMSPEVLSRVFEPFFTTKPAGKGTGLGLATVARIVEQNQGTIRVRSNPGSGTIFEVRFSALPIARRSSLPPPLLAPPAGRGRSVLLIEDDEGVRRAIARMLQAGGYAVLQTGSGREGLEQFAAHCDETTVVVVDLVLPDLDAVSLLRELRAIRTTVRVVCLTGHAEPAVLEPIEGLVAGAILSKPVDAATLLHAVGRDWTEDPHVDPAAHG